MYARANVSAFVGILHQLCPRCRRGRIFPASLFRWFPKMYERCPYCGLKFEREEGYFLGAMVISYVLAIVIVPLFAVILWFLTRWALEKTVTGALLLFLLTVPVVTPLSRVLWIYFDQTIDPDQG
jgi:uncharacterized protein (DUF983 family)